MSQITEINRASLAQLSVAAAELWEVIDNCESEIELTELLERQLDVQNATESKVDAIAYVADQLQVDLKTWEARLASIVALHTPIIERRRRQLEQLKSYLLRLHELGLLPERVAGKERRIDFQNNPPSLVLKVDPSHREFPEKFKQIEYSARSKDILAAYKAGEDINDFAEIVTRKHVRFRYQKSIQSKHKP
jgi:Siphovirus Gp157